MRDIDVRRAFHQSILRSHHNSDDVIVVDELGLKNGIVRADIAVLNCDMAGYEIKTDRDTLKRLPAQILAYNDVFDRAFIVASQKHLSKISLLIPQWWGIYEIVGNNAGSYAFTCLRDSGGNKRQNSLTIAQLLWKAEALEVLRKVANTEIKTSSTKMILCQKLCDRYCQEDLSKIVVHYLKQRDTWRASRPALL